MRKRENEQDYPFAWLDEVIEVTMNPNVTNVDELPTGRLEQIIEQAPAQMRLVYSDLKEKTLLRLGRKKIGLIAEQYHIAVEELRQQAIDNMTGYAPKSPAIETAEIVLQHLAELSACINKRYGKYLPEPSEENKETKPVVSLFKLILILSGDQIGIILRAAYQAGLVHAKSVRAAFRALAPYVSTLRKAEHSPDGLRNNSDKAETRDLDIVISILYKLIEIIKSYYHK